MDSTLLKGLRVLELLARSDRPRGASELSREMELSRSNVHRTFQTLVAAGYVRALDDGTYECTLKLFELGSAVMERVDVRRCAAEHIQRLAGLTQETVYLSALDGGDVVYLDKIESPQPVRAYASIGSRAPAYCVASGKALLSWLTEEQLDMIYPDGMTRWTEKTIVDRTKLRRELDRSHARGYAVNRGEWRSSVGGIAAVILNSSCQPEAAVGVSGPVQRVLPHEKTHRDAVLRAAREISRALGCRRYPSEFGWETQVG